MSIDQNVEKFLKDVDEISEILQGFNSEDISTQELAISKADQRLALIKTTEDEGGITIGSNRTLINKSPSSTFPQPDSETTQESFLAHLERDARERAQMRNKKIALANELKDLGNKAYTKGDYETAIQRYSEGLENIRDMQVLYTNRAQAYIKLKKYQDAITDCEWALKCDEKWLKAHVHMGKAFLGLKNYEEARRCYQKITDIDSNKIKLVKEYLNEVDVQQRKDMQEKKALEDLEVGTESAISVTKLLQKLSKIDQTALYYSGGIHLLAEIVKDCTAQTLFKINNGFRIITENAVIHRSLTTRQENPIHVDLCISVLVLWQAVCKGNEENQRLLISHSIWAEQILALLSSEVSDVQRMTLDHLRIYCLTENGRSLLLKHIDSSRLLIYLLEFLKLMDERAGEAMDILYSLTQEKRLKPHFRNFSSELLSTFTSLLIHLRKLNIEVFPNYVGVIVNLTEDSVVRRHIASSQACWDSCLMAVDECSSSTAEEQHKDILIAVLGFMFNLSLEMNSTVKELAVDICTRCLSLLSYKDGIILTRSVGILSRVLPQSTAAVALSVQQKIVRTLIKMLKAGGQKTSVYTIKTLAVCAKEDVQACRDVIKYDKKFRNLMNLLLSEDETIVGNTALCLGYCFDIPEAASSLLQSDILKLLLTHAGGNAKSSSVQQNAALALGKLCTTEPRYIAQLRELHGIEILNTCMKYIS